MSNRVEITLGAKDEASSVIEGMADNLRGLAGQLIGMAGLAGGGLGFGMLVKSGIEFNQTMQDSRAALAAMILGTHDFRNAAGGAASAQESMNKSFSMAEEVQQRLWTASKGVAATYQELLSAYQAGYGPAMAAGITDTKKLEQVVIAASQAVKVLVKSSDPGQMMSELRAMFTGEQGPDNQLNRVLGITAEQIKKVKAEGKDLAAFYMEKLAPYSDIAAQSTQSFSVQLSNVKQGFASFAGSFTSSAFGDIPGIMSELAKSLEELAGTAEKVGRSIAENLKAGFESVAGPVKLVMDALDSKVTESGGTWAEVWQGLAVTVNNLFAHVRLGIEVMVEAALHPLDALRAAFGAALAGIAGMTADVAGALGMTGLQDQLNRASGAVGAWAEKNNAFLAGAEKSQKDVTAAWEKHEKAIVSTTAATKTLSDVTAKAKPPGIDPEVMKKQQAELDKLRKEAEKLRDEVVNKWGQVGQTGMGLAIEKIKEKWDLIIPKLVAQYGAFSDVVEMATIERDQEIQRVEEDGWNKLLEKAKHGAKQYVSVVETDLLPGLISVFASIKNLTPIPPEWQQHAAKALSEVQDTLEDYGGRVKTYTTKLWGEVAGLFDSAFFAVMTLDLKGLEDAFKTFGTNILKLLSQVFSDIAQKWILTKLAIQTDQSTGVMSFGGDLWGNLGGEGLGGAALNIGVGAGIGSAVGMIGNGKYNASGATIGGMAGAIIGTYVFPVIGTVIGAIIGAIVGLIAGGIASPNTEEMVSAGIAESGKKTFDALGNDLFGIGKSLKKAGYDVDPMGLQADYRARVKAMSEGAYWTVASGDGAYNEKGVEAVMKQLIPKLGIMAMFGRQGYGLPNGNRDNAGGWGGLDWWAPGMDKDGNWVTKVLYDPNAPIPKMLTALGFTGKRIEEIAGQIDTHAPDEFLKWLNTLLEVVVGFDQLSKKFGGSSGKGMTGSDLWAEATTRGNYTALDGFKDTAANLLDLAAELPNYVGDEQVAKAKELVQLGNQYYESQVQYVQQLLALSNRIKDSISGQVEGMNIDTMNNSERINYYKTKMQELYYALSQAQTPEAVQAITQQIQSYGSSLWNLVKGSGDATSVNSWKDWITSVLNNTSSLAEKALKEMADQVAETSKGLKEAMEAAKLLFTDVNGALPTTAANTRDLGNAAEAAATHVVTMGANAKAAAEALGALAASARAGGGGSGDSGSTTSGRQLTVNDVITVLRRNPGILGRQTA